MAEGEGNLGLDRVGPQSSNKHFFFALCCPIVIPIMEANEGIEIVFHSGTNEIGLSYNKQRDLYVGAGAVKEGYLFDDANFAVSSLASFHCMPSLASHNYLQF